MKESDKKYYENREHHRQRRIKSAAKAKYRGEVALEWHKTNKLTKSTLPIFKNAMKEADKEWEALNKLA